MKQRFTIGLLLAFTVLVTHSSAQVNVAGFWLGVTYPSSPTQEVYNYTMTLTQTNATLGGTAQTANPNVPFGGLAYLSGNVAGTSVAVSEADKNGSTAVKNVCFWRTALVYNPTDESLTGTYETITNGTTCTEASGGKVELYRIVLKSGTTYCKGSPIDLLVTGKNIRWYASAAQTNVLATGNTFSPKITQTTTFYITQTLYQTESPPVPITIEVVEPSVKITTLNTGCDKANGSIAVAAVGSTNWQYSLNGGAFQTDPLFTSLKPGSYTVVAKNAVGCQAEQSVSITTETGPAISNLVSTPPKCATANGEISVIATGGRAPLTYSIDYGTTYQASPLFTRLAGGAYTLRARDANGCEVNRAINLPVFKPMTVVSTAAVSTSCGQANGQADLTITGGTRPLTYSRDNQNFQASNLFTSLSGGTYTLVARDSAGCTVSQSVDIAASTGPQPVQIQTTAEGCGLKNGVLLITPTQVTSQPTYSLDGQLFQQDATFPGLSGGSYTLTIRDDKNCVLTQPVLVPLNCANSLHLPTAFSPNHDNANDALRVYFGFPSLSIARFTVYDRWGAVIYNRANFVLTSGEPIWDGQLDGRAAPVGVYVYQLDCQFPDGTQTTYRESVALLN